MSAHIQVPSNKDFIKVNVTNSQNNAVAFEKKFAKDLTIAELKSKLEVVTGGNASTMQIELYNGDQLIAKPTDESLIGSLNIEDGMRIHVVDSFLFQNEDVPKFDLSDDQYRQRQNTVRDFLKKNKLGKYNEEEMKKIEERRMAELKEAEKLAEKAKIGLRCMVTAKGPRRIGTIMYNGPLEGKTGIFIGVKFDEPLGVNDGSVNGKRYFECAPKYGSIVPVQSVILGDFPEDDYDLDEEL